MYLHLTCDVNFLPPVKMHDEEIEFVSAIEFVSGCKLNSRFSAVDHFNYTAMRRHNILRKLCLSSSYVPVIIKLRLIKAVAVPRVSYGANIYDNIDSLSSNKLESVTNMYARYVFNKRKYERISQFWLKILDSDFQTQLNNRNLLFLHRLTRSRTPGY